MVVGIGCRLQDFLPQAVWPPQHMKVMSSKVFLKLAGVHALSLHKVRK